MSKFDYYLPQWISTRVYKTKNETRAVISNELDREFIELDGNSSVLWDCILKNEEGFNSELISNSIGKPFEEVNQFLEELLKINLIGIKNAKNKAIIANNDTKRPNINTSDRYTAGNYNEPSPGGTNLEAEYNLMDWCIENGFLYANSWELTYRCNERCVHCFNPGASHVEGDKTFRKVKELSLEKIKETLDDLKKIGVFRLLITGGEIFLRKDFFEIVEYIRKLRFSFTIFTNGTLMKEKDIEKIKDLYPQRIELSLYSHDPEIHDGITRLKGSWEKTINIAKYIKLQNIHVVLKTIVMGNTVNDVQKFENFCNELDIESSIDFNMSPGVDGSLFPVENLLPKAKDLILQCYSETSPLHVGRLNKPKKFDPKKLHGESVCGAGKSLMNITAEGNISPCNSLPLEVGNLNNIKMSEVWKNSSIGKKINKPEYNKEKSETGNESERLSSWQGVVRGVYDVCGNFERCGWCQKCPGMAYLETGSELKPSTTNCRNAAARMIAYDLLEEKKNIKKILKEFNEDELKNKYQPEIALWDPILSIEKNKGRNQKEIIRKRTKSTALEKLMETEGLI